MIHTPAVVQKIESNLKRNHSRLCYLKHLLSAPICHVPNPFATLASPPATKAVRTLPSRPGARGLQADAAADLTPAQRRCMVAGILALHMAGARG